MRKSLNVAAVAVAILTSIAVSGPVSATVIAKNYSMIALFTNPRYPVIGGRFSFSFDNAANVATTPSGLNTATINIPSLISGMSKLNYNVGFDELNISNYTNPSGCYPYITKMYCLDIKSVSASNPVGSFYYIDNFGSDAAPQYSQVYATSVTLTPVAGAAVPEPATWAMLVAGFGMVGATIRRKKALLASY